MRRSLRLVLYSIVIIAALYIAWLVYRQTEGFQVSNPAARPSRPASSGNTPCNDDEEQILSRCYRACPDGQNPTGDRTTCPVKRQSMLASSSCPSGYSYDVASGMCIKNTCDPDPDTGQTYVRATDTNGRAVCNPTKISKGVNSVGSYTPSSYVCYNNGSIPIRYIRIRPMTTSKTNKICINNIQVWDDRMKMVKALTASASDGTCVMNPIGFPDANCQSGKPFTSGGKYDTDSDGGMKNRATNSFWLLDLGSVVTVKKIEITQCSVRSPETAPVDGLRLEVFKELGGLGSTPLASRVLGQDSVQTVTFNFNRYDEYSGACFDVCPSVGTVQSLTDEASNTCVVATDGITKRSISEPMVISQAVKLPCNSQYLRAEAQGTTPAVLVSNMVSNPTNQNQCFSCDAFPGTIILPLDPYTYNIDSSTVPVQKFRNNAYIRDSSYSSLTATQKTILDSICPQVTQAVYPQWIGCRVRDGVDTWEYKYPTNNCRRNDSGEYEGIDYSTSTLYQCNNMLSSSIPNSSGTTQINTGTYNDLNNIRYICVNPLNQTAVNQQTQLLDSTAITNYRCPSHSIVVGDIYKPVCLNLVPFMLQHTSSSGYPPWSLTPATSANWPARQWVGSDGSTRLGSFT